MLMSDYFIADQEKRYFTSSGSKRRYSMPSMRKITIRNLTLSDPVFNPWDIFKEGSPKKLSRALYVGKCAIRLAAAQNGFQTTLEVEM